MNTDIRVIFVDLGGTFRVIRDDLEYKTAAKARIAELLGAEGDPTEFFDTVIDKRYDVYREWCLRFMCEAPEEMLWTRWLAYDFPKDRVKAAAKELTYAYRRTKGERVVVEGGVETVRELRSSRPLPIFGNRTRRFTFMLWRSLALRPRIAATLAIT